MSDFGSLLLVLVVFLVITAVVFYVGREMVCWYWKINEGLDLLRSIDRSLQAMASGGRVPLSVTPHPSMSADNALPRAAPADENGIVTTSADGKTAIVNAHGAALATVVTALHGLTIAQNTEVTVRVERREDAAAIIAACWSDGRGFRLPPVSWKVTG